MALRVGYLAAFDPFAPWAWSGSHRSMATALQRAGAEVHHIGRSYLDRPGPLTRLKRRVLRRLGRPRTWEQFQPQRFVEAVRRDLAETPCDVLYAAAASGEVAALGDAPPIVYASDATVRLLRETHAFWFRQAPPGEVDRMEQDEAEAVRRAACLIYPSDWAAASAIRDYGADPALTFRVEFGASLEPPPPADIALQREASGPCQLLFVGRDWEVKGGPIARAALVTLLDAGIAATLTVVGATIPPDQKHPALVALGLLDKSIPSQRERLLRAYREASVFLTPSRSEAFGVAFCEANAHGLPVFAARVGGVPSVIHDGENGFLLPLEAGGAAYAEAIARLWRDPPAYRALARSARRSFEQRLNWHAWAARVVPILREAAVGPGPRRVATP